MASKEFVASIVDDTTHIAGRIFSYVIQFLIILSLVTFSLETLPDLTQDEKQLLGAIELITVLIFTAEYLLRLYAAKRRRAFIFSFYGMIDLIAILPFYLTSGIDLRAARIFRLLRLIRILKLVRYNKAINRFHRALVIAKEELILFGFVALIVLYLSSVGIYYLEHEAQPDQFKSVFHSFWWAVTTLTTVGYGDMFPVTAGGRFFTFIVLMIGLGVVAVPTGLVASALTLARDEEQKKRDADNETERRLSVSQQAETVDDDTTSRNAGPRNDRDPDKP